MNKSRQAHSKAVILALFLALNLTLVNFTTTTAQSNNLTLPYSDPGQKSQQPGAFNTLTQTGIDNWRDTGLLLPKNNPNSGNFGYCFDATHPGILIVENTDPAVGPNGIYSYNWMTNQKSLLTTHLPASAYSDWACNEYNGLLFMREVKNGPTLRFSLDEPQGRVIEHFPTDWATDGSLQLYATGWITDGNLGQFSIDDDHKFWASSDGGLSWQERKLPSPGIMGQAVTRRDGRALYILTKPDLDWIIYFSADAGLTWEKRGDLRGQHDPSFNFTYNLSMISGNTANIDTLELAMLYTNPHVGDDLSLSTDGGRTFNEVALYLNTWQHPELAHTSQGILRVSAFEDAFGLTTNGGKNWQKLTTPFIPRDNPSYTFLQAQNRPDNLYLQGHLGDIHPLWYSGDGGLNWQKIGPDQLTFRGVTPYAPTTLIAVSQENKLLVLEQPEADKTVTKATIPSQLPSGQFFPQTGHNLQGLFLDYWQTHGGVAQFGYPKTEAFREYNPTDGKIYTVQYFERNRFEYHPENVGTPYEVLLGLLGNQLTAQRRASGENVFKPIADPHSENLLYFPQTGHTISLGFKSYWENNGGLSLYGYPTSEEFTEVNPDDGKSYTVQYFERNRFEYHPEYARTRYEVLLGLLGNSLLKLKGWS